MPRDKDLLLRKIPSVDAVLKTVSTWPWTQDIPSRLITFAAREATHLLRSDILADRLATQDEDEIHRLVLQQTETLLRKARGPRYRKVINATGIILHTALGRAVLAEKALRQIADHLSGYSLLQMDLDTGQRSRRDERIDWLLQELTGCEAATVVNNNAAATAIILNTVAKGKEVIVSRGQLIEIGGSFRLPEVMESAGVKLVEVGTTNKTHPRDYENAVTENTAAILRAHPSNYKIVGFTSEVPTTVLADIAQRKGIALIDDVGAGALVDFSRFGFGKEPTLPESVSAGADLVCCSADKLIGASQAGLILGKTKWVEAIRKNPMARMLRVDKLTLTVLEATLSLFLDESLAMREIPTLRMLNRPLAEIVEQANQIATALREKTSNALIGVEDGFSQMGSGSLPEQNLPSKVVAIKPKNISSEAFARELRLSVTFPPIIARVHQEKVLIDPRTILDGEMETLILALANALNTEGA